MNPNTQFSEKLHLNEATFGIFTVNETNKKIVIGIQIYIYLYK